MKAIHDDGHPDHCSEFCNGPHYGDNAPEVCLTCGGNGRACFYGCIDRSRPFEEFEGSTGAEESAEYDYYGSFC